MTMAALVYSDRYFDPCAVVIIFHGLFRTCAFPSHLLSHSLRIPSLELLQVSLETQKTETTPHPAIIGCFGGDKPVSVGCLNGSCTYRCISASTGCRTSELLIFISYALCTYMLYTFYVYTYIDIDMFINHYTYVNYLSMQRVINQVM